MAPRLAMPFISCIMPTADRRPFIPAAIEYFLRQDYPDSELIVVDDGSDPVDDLIPTGPRFQYLRLPSRHSIGAKRNLACAKARGDIIAHWDDDDWHAPHRLRYQVSRLEQSQASVCGIRRLFFLDIANTSAWRYVYPPSQAPWLSGSTLCYTHACWSANRFDEINISEDARFVRRIHPGHVAELDDSTFHIGIIHPRNVSPKNTRGAWWSPVPTEEIERIMGSDWHRYAPSSPPAVVTVVPSAAPPGQRKPAMHAVARTRDLAQPEFAAYNHGIQLPWMRRWELPFALFAARLADSSSVLDCTINPCGFGERLAQLYPHVLYRHWNPVRAGAFTLPCGYPDASFDRVFCINTIEHLLASQRRSLIEDLARKLKPGGKLILTGDYYFDSFWSHPVMLREGVLRADRTEVFNGFNQVTARDWETLCRAHGLRALSPAAADPDESDPTLYRNQPPYPHASIGAVFQKEGPDATAPSRRVVLALLTWNTRAASVESLQAYQREAAMLQRLGHQPFLCVCDNGSDDGSQRALQAIEDSIPCPHRFILNPSNLGNCIARNQIIAYAREVQADYVLFMDGDIEVVPFSSFAMLRYMETHGRRMGCIGASSQEQTTSRDRASKAFFAIDPHRVRSTNVVGWTQYGMFRCAVFDDEIRFDDAGPFGGPGWGYEDNDLAFQMELKGYRNDYFSGMTYLHRNMRSSVENLRRAGADPNLLCQQRRQYLIEKWASHAAISSGPLEHIRRGHIAL